MEELKNHIQRTSLFNSGETFTISEMTTRTREDRGLVKIALDSLTDDKIVCKETVDDRNTYRKISFHWLNKQKLAKYRPPRDESESHLSEWLVI
jgi:hypothetical protein